MDMIDPAWMSIPVSDFEHLHERIRKLEEWRRGSAPIIATLAIYGDGGVNLAELVQKARALNERTVGD